MKQRFERAEGGGGYRYASRDESRTTFLGRLWSLFGAPDWASDGSFGNNDNSDLEREFDDVYHGILSSKGVRTDEEELALANRQLQKAALTDALTGVYNRRFALERLEQEWTETTSTGQSLACLLCDLDHFKRVNDTYGHQAGDNVLREISALLRRTVRAYDILEDAENPIAVSARNKSHLSFDGAQAGIDR